MDIDRETYLSRIYDYINLLAQRGSLTRAQAVLILQHAEQRARSWGQRESLPYWNELNIPPWEWYEETADIRGTIQEMRVSEATAERKTLLAQRQTEATKRAYLPQLEEYLDYGVSTGLINPVQSRNVYERELRMIEEGTDPRFLPNYAKVQEYQSYLGAQPLWEKYPEVYATPEEMRAEARTRATTWIGREEEMRLGMRETERASNEQQLVSLLGQLGGQADWIRRWQVEKELEQLRAPREEAELPMGVPAGLVPKMLQYAGGREAFIRETAERFPELGGEPTLAWKQMAGQVAGWAGGAPAPVALTAPPVPSWLPQFVPQLAGERQIAKWPTTTPSGQMWARTPWSTREALRGYTQYAGFRPYEDILQQMQIMIPKTPWGAGRARWTPPRQWG